jgi:hypothetical protein
MIKVQDRSLGQRHRIRNAELLKHATDSGNTTDIIVSGIWLSHRVLSQCLVGPINTDICTARKQGMI